MCRCVSVGICRQNPKYAPVANEKRSRWFFHTSVACCPFVVVLCTLLWERAIVATRVDCTLRWPCRRRHALRKHGVNTGLLPNLLLLLRLIKGYRWRPGVVVRVRSCSLKRSLSLGLVLRVLLLCLRLRLHLLLLLLLRLLGR